MADESPPKGKKDQDEEKDNGAETLIVPPPGFRERLAAAQRARATNKRASIEIPIPGKNPDPAPAAPNSVAQGAVAAVTTPAADSAGTPTGDSKGSPKSPAPAEPTVSTPSSNPALPILPLGLAQPPKKPTPDSEKPS